MKSRINWLKWGIKTPSIFMQQQFKEDNEIKYLYCELMIKPGVGIPRLLVIIFSAFINLFSPQWEPGTINLYYSNVQQWSMMR